MVDATHTQKLVFVRQPANDDQPPFIKIEDKTAFATITPQELDVFETYMPDLINELMADNDNDPKER